MEVRFDKLRPAPWLFQVADKAKLTGLICWRLGRVDKIAWKRLKSMKSSCQRNYMYLGAARFYPCAFEVWVTVSGRTVSCSSSRDPSEDRTVQELLEEAEPLGSSGWR